MGDSSRRIAVRAALLCACGTGDTRVDPGDLELRDLLGVAPEVATAWTADQRASARHVLADGLHETGEPTRVSLAGTTLDDQVARALAQVDADRTAGGTSALGLVRVERRARRAARVAGIAAGGAGDVLAGNPTAERRGRDPADGRVGPPSFSHGAWRADADRARRRRRPRRRADPLQVAPAPRLAVVAAYVETSPRRMLVNPVLLAALEPSALAAAPTPDLARAPDGTTPAAVQRTAHAADNGAGNPYSFYGSYEECAAAQQSLAATTVCRTVGARRSPTPTARPRCQQLAANGGRGYFEICVDLALAIGGVSQCASKSAPSCPQNDSATTSLSDLAANDDFLDMPACSAALDACLAQIYGAPPQPFPGLDGGVGPSEPPRQTAVSCDNSCSNDNNTTFNPSCDCSGPSCNNSLSCDSGCDNNTSCDSCSSNGGGGGGGGGGGCGSSGSGGGGGGGCGGGDSSSNSSGCDSGCNNGSGGGCSGGSSSSGGGCSGGSGGDCSGGSGGGCSGGSGGGCSGGSGGNCNSGGGGGNCNVARNDSAGFATAMSIAWALLPVGLASRARRKARKTKQKEVQP